MSCVFCDAAKKGVMNNKTQPSVQSIEWFLVCLFSFVSRVYVHWFGSIDFAFSFSINSCGSMRFYPYFHFLFLNDSAHHHMFIHELTLFCVFHFLCHKNLADNSWKIPIFLVFSHFFCGILFYSIFIYFCCLFILCCIVLWLLYS